MCTGTTLTIWRNERFRGRAFAVPRTAMTEGWEQAMLYSAQDAADRATDPLAALVVDVTGFLRDPEGLQATIPHWPDAVGPEYQVRPLREGPNAFSYEVNFPTDALLYLAQSAYDGWTVTIDDERSELITNAGGTFLVAAVPAGTHTVTFRFIPPSLATGRNISLLALLILLLGCWREQRRRSVSGPMESD